MVIVKNPKRGTIGPSMKGLFYAYEQGGEFQVKAWPPKRGKPRSEAQAQTQALFKEACQALKRMPAPFLNYARDKAKGTPMLPRDYLMAALYGRFQTLVLPDGTRRYSMATRVDMSILLDNIGAQEGMLLYRGTSDLWIGLPVGEVGQVLTIDEALLPTWQAPDGGGGSTWRHAPPSSVSGRAFNTKGVFFNPLLDGEIDQIAFTHSFNAGQVITLGVYRISVGTTGTIAEVLQKQVFTGTQDGSERTALMLFENPIPLTGGERYAVALSTTGAATNYATRMHSATTFTSGFPVTGAGGYAEMTSDNPLVGDVFSTIAGTSYAVYVRAAF